MQVLSDALLHLLTRWGELRVRFSEERGQTLSEYGLLITVISVAVVLLAAVTFREHLAAASEAAASCLDGSC